MVGVGGHHLYTLARGEVAIHHTHVRHHAAVGIVDRVKDHGAGLGVGVARGGRDLGHDPVKQLVHALARLARHPHHVVGIAPDEGGELGGVLVRVRGRQVDLVEDGDDRQVILDRHVQVRQRLRLDALRRIDQEDRALARGERTGDLVSEVHVAGGVDHVERVGLPVHRPRHAHRLGLNRDPALALDIHAVKVLGAHLTLRDDVRQLQHPIGKRGLAVIDVGDDAEIPNLRGRSGRGLDLGQLGRGRNGHESPSNNSL